MAAMTVWRVLLPLAAAAAHAADSGTDFFESKVRPLLAGNCYGCHARSAMGGLRLDDAELFKKGGKSGPAVKAGKPDESLLIQAVRRTHDRLKMPPSIALRAEEVETLVEWVKRGADYPDDVKAVSSSKEPTIAPEQRTFWSFQPVRNAAQPKVSNAAWGRSPIDAFVLAKLDEKKLKPAGPADRRTLLRRVTLDLTGLPPSPEEVDAFLNDKSADAYAKVVDRLLQSPHFGEKWARHWLDLARYSDGRLAAGEDTPMPNAWRYRDWVVEAFNKDLPYDKFVKAQLAADLMPESERAALLPGLGFQSLGNGANDQLDVTTKAFLGLTVGCAECHDHKYDPIPTKDYYSLLGIFRSASAEDHPLAPDAEVTAYRKQKEKIDAQKELIAEFIKGQTQQLIDVLARHTSKYLMASWKVQTKRQPDAAAAAKAEGIDEETLKRWIAYLAKPEDREHPYMKPWYDAVAGDPSEEKVRAAADEFQKFALQLLDDQREVEDKNYVAFGGKKGSKDERTRQYTNIVSLPVLKYYQWRELGSEPYRKDGMNRVGGVYHYGAGQIDRFLSGVWTAHLDSLRAELKEMEKALPPMYPFLHSLKDGKPADMRVHIRGDGKNLGELAPRRFLSVLSKEGAEAYKQGSGRLQFAADIVAHPIAARVAVNRIWQHHFGTGIVKSASNFGQMGERPTHPELLDYLAAKLVESGWSLKAIHREIALSNVYRLSTEAISANYEADPENRLLWRANLRHRLDLESLRDSVLAVSGKLDRKAGGAPSPLKDDNFRRSLYLTVSRTRLDGTMSLFDFPDPNATADERPVTAGPLQGLFFLNSKFIANQAEALAERVAREAGDKQEARIERAYRLLLGRTPDPAELRLGLQYVAAGGAKAWPGYLQVLLGSGEFTSVN